MSDYVPLSVARALIARVGTGSKVWVCKACEGTGLTPTGGYTLDGGAPVRGAACGRCDGDGLVP